MQNTFWQGPLHFTSQVLSSKHITHSQLSKDERFFMKFLALYADFCISSILLLREIIRQRIRLCESFLKQISVHFFSLAKDSRKKDEINREDEASKLKADHQKRNIKKFNHFWKFIIKLTSFPNLMMNCYSVYLLENRCFRCFFVFLWIGTQQIYCIYRKHLSSTNMNNLYPTNNPFSSHQKDTNLISACSQRIREVYISPYKQNKQEQHAGYSNTACRFIKLDSHPSNDPLPPKAAPFRRSSRNSSKDRLMDRSGEQKTLRSSNDSLLKGDASPRIASLEKKLQQEKSERERWKTLCGSQQQKVKTLTEELAKSREERQALHGELLTLRNQLEQSEKNLSKSNEQIDTLTKSLKESKINQKSLANLKNLQNQLEQLQQKNLALAKDHEQLVKANKKMKGELFKKKQCTSESEFDTTKKEERIRSLQMEIKRLKQELLKDRSQREILLQNNLHTLEKRLYEKDNEIKRISVQLSCLDRKKYISIDEVKAKKDQEIKDLRQRFNKVNKDLKETRMELNEKKRVPKEKSPFVRKIKSSQLLGAASESQVTFEFSSEA